MRKKKVRSGNRDRSWRNQNDVSWRRGVQKVKSARESRRSREISIVARPYFGCSSRDARRSINSRSSRNELRKGQRTLRVSAPHASFANCVSSPAICDALMAAMRKKPGNRPSTTHAASEVRGIYGAMRLARAVHAIAC